MNLPDLFRTVYLPQVRDFLASSLRDVDIIVPVENKGARLFEEASALLPTPLKGQVYFTNAIPYLRESDFAGKVIGIVDDSALYGRNLRRVSDMFHKGAHRRCFAFAAYDEPDVVEKRHKCGLRIDSALHLRKAEYDVFISSLSAFLRSRGHALPIDNTTFTLHYPRKRSMTLWNDLLNQLATLGTVTETWSEELEGRLLAATLHFPAGFSPESFSPVAIERDGAIKIRLFTYVGSNIITCNPMVFVALKEPNRNLWDAIPESASGTYRAFRAAFRSQTNYLHGEPNVVRLALADQLGFYLDCELLAYVLGTLHGQSTMPEAIEHNAATTIQYYGSHLGHRLVSVLDEFAVDVRRSSVDAVPATVETMPEPRQGILAIAKMEDALYRLRETYRAQGTNQPDASKWKHRGFSFAAFLRLFGLDPLEGSIYLDVLCDTGHLVPFNFWDGVKHSVLRCYRTAEEPGEERGKLIAYVIFRLRGVKRFRENGAIPKTATEKALVLLKHYLGTPVLDPDIKVIRAPLGGVIKLVGPELCAEASSYGLDYYPTKWYHHAEGKDGYVASPAFEKAIKERSIEKFLSGLNADPYLDRLVALLNEERGLQMLVLMSILAGREFGLTYVTADVELGLKGFRESSYRGVDDVKAIAAGRSKIGIAREKLRMLANDELLRDLRSQFPDVSVTDSIINANLCAISPLSVPFRLAATAVDLADALLEALTRLESDPQLMLGEKMQPPREPPNVIRVLSDLEKILRLGEAVNVGLTDPMEARLVLYRKLTGMLYAVANVRTDFHRSLPEGTQERYFLIADLTNFTKLGFELTHSRFRDAADEAMNVIYSYAKLFGAFVAKPAEGDKAILGFPTRGQALAGAAFCSEHFRTLGEAIASEPFFGIKCGLAAGEYSRIVGDDLVGNAINIASRLCSTARSGGAQGGVIATRQMMPLDLIANDAFAVSITSSKEVIGQVESVEVNSEAVCNRIID